MSFRSLSLKKEYRTKTEDIVNGFYIPVLKRAFVYKRSVGYFSSSSLSSITEGIYGLVKNGGKIQLVASPILSEEDIEAIREGYAKREEIIEKALLSHLTVARTEYEEKRLGILAELIANGILDIKIATLNDGRNIGIYHEKMGVLEDEEGNIIAFSGSNNETRNGMTGNYETMDVYASWESEDSLERALNKRKAFENIWNDEEPGIEVNCFTSVSNVIIEKYKRKNVDYSVDEMEYPPSVGESDIEKDYLSFGNEIIVPDSVIFRDYQIQAIKEWEDRNYRGIFDMCTGAGKTFTALGAMERLSHNTDRLAILIVVPYQHLVEQWVEDIKRFNINPIVGFSDSEYRNYRDKLRKSIFDYNLGVKKILCFICTNATFKIDKVRDLLDGIKDNILLVVDEAHNFGSTELRKTLDERYEYRLALSATLDRHGDLEGTAALYQYFGDKCITYTLDKAIEDENLTEYYYYPHIVYLSATEYEDYSKISREIKRHMNVDKKTGKLRLDETAKRLAIKRARIVAGAVEKISKLKELIQPYREEHNLLIYSGATTLNGEELPNEEIVEDIRQIDYISRVLGIELGMNLAQFTSRENTQERNNLIERFKQAEELQGLVAIKCLDEGVNIPSIKTAFILASTTNPKEYIQRRGRVLRKAKGKHFAEIYDMITLPRSLEEAGAIPEDEVSMDLSLVKNEINRMLEFKRLALNPLDSDKLIDKITNAFGLKPDEEFMDLEEYHFD
ncbi:MAG: DEAD/DEAH box helicase family protein [Eubacterium sp.]|nr:DEAD/DEAH box helicase family protein [Eubacterium sp.]